MGAKWNDDEDSITDINITPLVDVVLVLLVIFMVTANFIVNKGIPVSLPKASQTEKSLKNKQIAFSIDNEENYYYNNHKIKLYELNTYLSGIDPNGVIVSISADKKASYDSVVKLMDYLRAFHLSDFNFIMDNAPK